MTTIKTPASRTGRALRAIGSVPYTAPHEKDPRGVTIGPLKIGVKLPASATDAGEFIADVTALEAAGADIIWVDGGSMDLDPWLLAAGIAAVTHRIRLGVIDATAPPSRVTTTLNRLTRGRFVAKDAVRWPHIPMPADRAAWQEALSTHEAAGTKGVIVPWDPRLIDLLRNSEPDDRSDLLISTG